MNSLRHYVRLTKAFLHFGVCKFAEYPLNAVIAVVSALLREVTGFIGIFLIAVSYTHLTLPTTPYE